MTAPLSRPDLHADETIRFEQRFTPRMFLTHLKTTVVVTDRRVLVYHPRVIFGVVEHGYAKGEIPLRHVAQISSGTTTSTGRILGAIGCLVLALGLFTGSTLLVSEGLGVLIGLVLLGAAAFLFLSAHTNGVVFTSTGGRALVASGSKAELPAIEQAAAEIGTLLFS